MFKIKINHIIAALCVIGGFASCEIDNYDEPEAGIAGTIIDSTTGQPLQTAAGKTSMQIRIWEDSWAKGDSSISVNPQDLNMRQDGTFYNDKLFAGDYTVAAFQGAFYPLNESEYQKVQLKNGSVSQVQFTVTPYLSLEWVKEPYMDGDTLKCSVRFVRNLPPADNDSPMPDVRDLQLYISHNQYVPGTDPQVTPPSVTIKNEQEGEVVELKSLPIKYSNQYWVRVGGRCSDNYQKYNYTDIKTINITVNH